MIEKAVWIPEEKVWNIKVTREGQERDLRVKHLVFATGTASPRLAYKPEIPGKVRLFIMRSGTMRAGCSEVRALGRFQR